MGGGRETVTVLLCGDDEEEKEGGLWRVRNVTISGECEPPRRYSGRNIRGRDNYSPSVTPQLTGHQDDVTLIDETSPSI